MMLTFPNAYACWIISLSGGTYCCAKDFICSAYSLYSSFFFSTMCFFSLPPRVVPVGDQEEKSFAACRRGPGAPGSASCFLSSPFRLMLTCSTQVYWARNSLFLAMDSLSSATRSWNFGPCALAGELKTGFETRATH